MCAITHNLIKSLTMTRAEPPRFTLPMLVSGFVAVLVGYSSSGAIIYQMFQAAGATPAQIGGWLSVLGIAQGIASLGLSLRSYLEHLKLQMLPRLSVVLTFVVVLIAAISLFSHKLGLERGLSVALFPMVILTMTIERLSITWEERGANHALKVAIGTLFAASLAHLIMTVPELVYFVFTFPAILLILVGFMLAMGRYRGYRLTELVRFKAFLKKADA